MMPRNERLEQIRGQQAAVASLANVPAGQHWAVRSTVDRLTARLRQQEEEERRQAVLLNRFKLLFGGAPVRGTLGIDAGFGSQAAASFDTLLRAEAAATSRDGALEHTGRLPNTELDYMIRDVARGSFGFEYETKDPTIGKSLVIQVLHEIEQMSNAIASGDGDTFMQAIAETDKRVLNAWQTFVGRLNTSGATFHIEGEDIEFGLRSPSAVARAHQRLSAVQREEQQVDVEGYLAALPHQHRFELITASNQLFQGRVAQRVPNEVLLALNGRHVRGTLRATTAYGGPGQSSKTSYLLLSAEELGQEE